MDLENNQKESLYYLLNIPFSQQIWLQLEDDQLRNNFHFYLLRLYALSLNDKELAKTLVEDFIEEMKTINNEELTKKAEELLISLH